MSKGDQSTLSEKKEKKKLCIVEGKKFTTSFASVATINIARGTTDPGYCLFNLSYLFS